MGRVPLCKSAIYSLIRQGKFPKQVKLGPRAIAWRESEIEEWLQSRSEGAA